MTITKDGWLSSAKRRSLGKQTEPLIHPTVQIAHVIVGSAEAGYAVFKPQGYVGDESHFIVCGPRDESAGHKDGELWQLQDIHHQADAQFAGNNYALSWETSGMPNEPWSSEMMVTLEHGWAELCHKLDLPPRLVPRHGPVGKGLGYHELREDWNTDHHACPGPIREGQLRQIVIPKIRDRLGKGKYKPPTPKTKPAHEAELRIDGIFGMGTISAVQHVLAGHHFLNKSDVDGVFGPHSRRAFKLYLHSYGLKMDVSDPDIGHSVVRALRLHLHMDAGETWNNSVTRHLQRALNGGRF